MKRFSVIAFVFLMTPVYADLHHEMYDCDTGKSQHEMNDCQVKRYNKLDDEMNRLYTEKLNVMHTEGAIKRLRDAQRAWIAFRDKVCLYEAGPPEGTGSEWPFDHYVCLEYHTKMRVKDLRDYLTCTSDDCPN